jgi:hypothetical protein
MVDRGAQRPGHSRRAEGTLAAIVIDQELLYTPTPTN